ncbi:peptidylprolyl isomerase [Pseudomonas chlororaphis]|uniref:peptidylprolyl isomerase n=1 Tax=Pseudomonas chlororaphis TaxID=587753 RepID=UPI000789E28C|nr:peptidylprolyl isomerase [Pseudomonas chlororaphis]AMS13839.1 peptidylprolyl isomerase [Pseudomonas chlororaphis]
MSKKNIVISLGALVLLVIVLSLGVRLPHDPKVQEVLSHLLKGKPGAVAVARLGDLTVDPDELKTLLTNVPIDYRKQLTADRPLLEGWIRKRLAEKSVLEQARAQGWSQRPEVQKKIQTLKEQIVYQDFLLSESQVPRGYPSETELQQAYDAGKSTWLTAEQFRIAQIFIPAPDKNAMETARKQAWDISRKAQDNPSSFAALVAEYSKEPTSAKNSGEIGLHPLDQLLPAVRLTVARLKQGEVSDPVQSTGGFHVIKLIEVQAPRVATLEELRGDLTRTLRAQRQEQLAEAYLTARLNTASFSINDTQLDKVLKESPK